MRVRYMALSPLNLEFIDQDEIPEALAEFGCKEEVIDHQHYIVCDNLKALAQMMFTLDLPGAIIELTGVYDSHQEESEIITD